MRKSFFNKQLIESYTYKSVTCVYILLLFLCSTTVFSQNIAISRTLTDTSGEVLIGVNVSVKGITNGTITDLRDCKEIIGTFARNPNGHRPPIKICKLITAFV
ncbi:TonB-dependent receptor SusC [termite gut metagenome]|uniref:TonB-dependent receptor SusC n=1 Tax=termite gut metagenome TaxID=433724 RepID=A0A5J4S323_9ZZZZ